MTLARLDLHLQPRTAAAGGARLRDAPKVQARRFNQAAGAVGDASCVQGPPQTLQALRSGQAAHAAEAAARQPGSFCQRCVELVAPQLGAAAQTTGRAAAALVTLVRGRQ